MFKLFRIILRRDLMLAFRRKSDLAQVIFFFAVVVTLVPLGVGAETNILRSIAPGVVWVAALLAALLSLPRMFEADHADGTLEQMLVTAEPLPVVVVAKVFAHWLVTGVPMTIFAAVFGILFDLPLDVTLVMVASLFLGTPVLSLVGARGRRTHARPSRRRRAHEPARASALHSRPHLRRGRQPGGRRLDEPRRALHDRGRPDAAESRARPDGRVRGPSHRRKLMRAKRTLERLLKIYSET